MSKNDEAYEIKITPIISNETFNRVKKVEAIQTKTIIFFRYICATLYRDYSYQFLKQQQLEEYILKNRRFHL
jgi:hypothetical protein